MSLFDIFFWVYILLCSLLLPSWALFKRKRKILSLTLAIIPVLFGYLLYSYLYDPKYEDDHGIAVAGLILIVPLLSFLCQLVVYVVCKITIYKEEKDRERS